MTGSQPRRAAYTAAAASSLNGSSHKVTAASNELTPMIVATNSQAVARPE